LLSFPPGKNPKNWAITLNGGGERVRRGVDKLGEFGAVMRVEAILTMLEWVLSDNVSTVLHLQYNS